MFNDLCWTGPLLDLLQTRPCCRGRTLRDWYCKFF